MQTDDQAQQWEESEFCIILPEPDKSRPARICSPRLVRSERAADLVVEMIEETSITAEVSAS